jgi:hypothetical protein
MKYLTEICSTVTFLFIASDLVVQLLLSPQPPFQTQPQPKKAAKIQGEREREREAAAFCHWTNEFERATFSSHGVVKKYKVCQSRFEGYK